MVNRANQVLTTESYTKLSEAEKWKWWKKSFPELSNAIRQYNERMEVEKRQKYEEKKLHKIKQTNRLASFTNQAVAYGGPLSTAKISNNFFEDLIAKSTPQELSKVLNIECSILRILHPADQVLFRTKKLDKSIRKQVPIDSNEIITNLKEYFMTAETTDVSATSDLSAYFEADNMEMD